MIVTDELGGHDHEECAQIIEARRDAVAKVFNDMRTHCEEEAFGESLVNRFVLVVEMVDPGGDRYLTTSQDGRSEAWDALGLLHAGLDAVRDSGVW